MKNGDYIDIENIPIKKTTKVNWEEMIGRTLKYVKHGKTKTVLLLEYFKKGNTFFVSFKDNETSEIVEKSTEAFKHCTFEYNTFSMYQEIDWNEAAKINFKISFSLQGIEGCFTILENFPNHVIVEWNGKKIKIDKSSLINLRFKKLLTAAKEFKHPVGTIIVLSTGKVKILEHIYVSNGKYRQKGYKYKCLQCGNISEDSETHITKSVGCSICLNRTVKQGYNDLYTTHPEYASLLVDNSLGFRLKSTSTQIVQWECPKCSYHFNLSPLNAIKYGLSCPMCSNTRSMPERIMTALLRVTKIRFDYQKIFDWSKSPMKDGVVLGKKIYDFFLPDYNCIIETHGAQHYRQNSYFVRSSIAESENDVLKEQLAKENGISKYIVIDCSRNELEFLKQSIINSGVLSYLDIEELDWSEVFRYSQKSTIDEVVELYQRGLKLKDLSLILGIHTTTIRRHLLNAAAMGRCDFQLMTQSKKEKMNLIVSQYNSNIPISQIVINLGITRDGVVSFIREAAAQGLCQYETQTEKKKRITQRAMFLKKQGYSIEQIAKELECSPSTIARYLKTECT